MVSAMHETSAPSTQAAKSWHTRMPALCDRRRLAALPRPGDAGPTSAGHRRSEYYASVRWLEALVASPASPGNPSHVMFDDRYAEHIPGCNMAFRRNVILELGGFDSQFRTAGDDVDFCWRLLDHGGAIGYASGAFVWHHRRETVKAYLKQQIGYGRAEALLHFMHPHRFSLLGHCGWHGRIYGSGATGLPLRQNGFTTEPTEWRRFRRSIGTTSMACGRVSPGWSGTCLRLFMLALSFLFWPLVLISGLMWSGSLALAAYAARKAPLPKNSPWWCRPLVGALHLLQPPVARMVQSDLRLTHVAASFAGVVLRVQHDIKRISPRELDLYWSSTNGAGREELLNCIANEAKRLKWLGVFNNAWSTWDIKLVGDLWHTLHLFTVTEELGGQRRFTRARIMAKPTLVNRAVSVAALIWSSGSPNQASTDRLGFGIIGFGCRIDAEY